MIRLSLVTSVIGYLCLGFVLLMVVPLVAACILQQPDSIFAFSVCIVASVALGRLAMRADKDANFDNMNRMESMAVVCFGWCVLALLGAIPYMYFGLSFVDSFFESMSGFTTTGSTILTDFSIFNSSMFFYRSYTQWIGGLGILVIFVALLPQLAIAGRQLFFAEVSAESKDQLSPRIKDTAGQLLAWYVILTLLCVAGLCRTGMNLTDAFSNSFSTLAAGGFSPNGESIMGYHNPGAEWVIIIFMFLAGANFVLQVKSYNIFVDYLNSYSRKEANKSLRKKYSFFDSIKCFFGNTELIAYAVIVLLAVLFISIALCRAYPGMQLTEIIRQAFFQCLSIITTTGSASIDYDKVWVMSAKAILVVLMFIGGCSGSAGGGMKVVRIVILLKYFWKVLLKSIYPEAVIRMKFDNRMLRESDVQPVLTFFMFYLMLFFIGGAVLSFIENSVVVGFSGSIACLGNIGPGFEAIGPMGSFGGFHGISKIICAILMWAGRLEVMALVVFMRPEVWRGSRW